MSKSKLKLKQEAPPLATDPTEALVARRQELVAQFQAAVQTVSQAQARCVFLRGAIAAVNDILRAAGVDVTTLDQGSGPAA